MGGAKNFLIEMEHDMAKESEVVFLEIQLRAAQRKVKFLREHQEALQGKYDALVEFGSSATGMYSYSLDLYRLPVMVTINNDTKNLQLLQTDDFTSKREHVYLLSFSGRPGESPPAKTLAF